MHRTAFLVWAALAPWLAAVAPCGADDRAARLVAALGDESWSRREDAQNALLQDGLAVAELLETACRSENPELAYRARYLLSRLDPSQVQCQVLRFLLLPEPRLVMVAHSTGVEGEEMLARPVSGLNQPAPDIPGPGAFSIRYRTLAGDGDDSPRSDPADDAGGAPTLLEVTVAERGASPGQGADRAEMPAVTLPSNAMALLRVGELALFRRLGAHVRRERHPYLLILRVKAGRKSRAGEIALPADPDQARAELEKELAHALASSSSTERRSGLAVASWLRPARAASELEAIVKDPKASPEDRALACLGLDRAELLRLLLPALDDGDTAIAGEASGREAPPSWAEDVPDALRARAAARCLEKGDQAGLAPALAHVAAGDPAQLHAALAAITDFTLDGATPAARREIAAAAFSQELLGHTLWQDLETEHFLLAAADALDPSDAGSARAALDAVAALARGELGPVNAPLRALFDLWRKIAARAAIAPAGDLQLWMEIVPSLKEPHQLTEAVSLLEPLIAEKCSGSPPGLDDRELAGVLEAVSSVLNQGDPQLFGTCVQSLGRIARALCLRPGQLRAVVGACIAAAGRGQELDAGAAAQSSGYLRQLQAELVRLTGQHAIARTTGGEAFNAEAWREWLHTDAASGAGEKSGGPSASPAASPEPRPLVYYEIDFELQSPGRGGSRHPPARLIDARRLELGASRQAVAVDRWGNRAHVRVDDEPTPVRAPPAARGAGESRENPPAPPPRFRVNGRMHLSAGVPSLTTIGTRTLSAMWYETSDHWFGSRAVSGAGAPGYRTLHFIDFLETEPPPAPAADPESLWSWVLENKILTLPRESRIHWDALSAVLRTLRLEAGIPSLRQQLRSAPSADVAEILLELGDQAGEEYLRERLGGSAAPAERLRSALALAAAGSSDGASALVDLTGTASPQVAAQGYRVVMALESYLTRAPTSDPVRRRVIGALVAKLDDTTYQHRAFLALEREAGTDFGYTRAHLLQQAQEKRQGIAQAIAQARAWWAGR